jgi:hypothetical protein
MATFPRALLMSVPLEIFSITALFLDASDLYALYLGGDVALNDRLLRPGVITRFALERDNRPLSFPSFAFLFPSLLEFDMYLGYYTKCYGLTKRTYAQLPKNLRKLKLMIESPGFVLLSPLAALAPKAPGPERQRHLELTLIDLAETFPYLDELVLRGSWSELEPITSLVLPPFLTSLDLFHARISSNAWLDALPTCLTSLKVFPSVMTEEMMTKLPRGLKNLQLRVARTEDPSPACIKLLPRELESLSLDTSWTEASPYVDLPASLTSLFVRSSPSRPNQIHHPKGPRVTLPAGLTSFTMIPMRSMEDWIFPDSLLHLEVSGMNGFFNFDQADDSLLHLPCTFPPRLRSLRLAEEFRLSISTPKCLPQTLTSLDVCNIEFEDPEDLLNLPSGLLKFSVLQSPTWSMAHLENLKLACPDLKGLDMAFGGLEISTKASQSSTTAMIELAETLTSLRSSNGAWLNLARLSCLPSTLTSLEIQGGAWFDGACMVQLPRQLTWLIVATATSCVDSDFEHLPRGLQCLRLLSKFTLTDACIEHLPPGLTDLKIHSGTHFSDEAILRLPRSLASLLLGGGQTLSSQSIPNFPKFLGSLQILAKPILTTEYFAYQEHRLSTRRKRVTMR